MWSDPSQAFLGKHAPCLYHLFEDTWPASLLPGAQRFLSPAHLAHQASVCHLIHQVSYDLAYDTQTQEVQQGCPPPPYNGHFRAGWSLAFLLWTLGPWCLSCSLDSSTPLTLGVQEPLKSGILSLGGSSCT